MLKTISICAALVVLGTGAVYAQQQDTVLQKLEVPGADFDFVVVMSKSSLAQQAKAASASHPLVAYPIGSELAMADRDDIETLFRSVRSSQVPIYAFEVERQGGSPSNSVAVYVVPKCEPTTAAVR